MEEEKKESKFVKFFKDFGWVLAVVLTLGLIFFIINRKSDDSPKKILKSKLAKQYGVSVELMMNWAKLLFPENIKSIYVGEKVQTVKIEYFHHYLGKPEERPKTEAGDILTKEDFATAFFMNRSTLRRKIQKLEEPEVTIGMSQEVYKSLKTFPPKQARLIFEYLESNQV